MANFRIKGFLQVAFLMIAIGVTISWGIVGHQRINRGAVMALPKPLQTFFYNHIDFLTQESTVPDLRKSVLKDKEEGGRHFFDMENFGVADSFPKTLEAAKKKYDNAFLSKNGTLPWYIQDMMAKLTLAFKEKKKTEILFIAGDLAHYIGDAHMPLHTTDNYDGQNTNQKGIHALWESRLPELFAKKYNLYVNNAKYIDNVEQATWGIINDTHSLIPTLLAADKSLRTTTPENRIYKVDETGALIKNKYDGLLYSDEYATQFHSLLNGMVENQMKKAITATASFWYTAWVNAGKPNLDDLDTKELTKRNSKFLKKDSKLYTKGQFFGLENVKE
jgi:hypothetical protein